MERAAANTSYDAERSDGLDGFGEMHPIRSGNETRLEQHTKIFASMCPDEILDHYDNYRTRPYQTTLMLGDISGFTDLTEKYSKTGKGGPSKLTEILNSYIGAMVQEILSHNGDVVKFSGDAFIVMWKVKEGVTMRDLAVGAIQTACTIQKHFGTYNTDIGVTLRVKLAIASGKTYFTSIGDPGTMSHYIITGKAVWDAKFAEGLCRGGDILVASSSWQWANPHEYICETLPGGEHTLIIACSSSWYYSGVSGATGHTEASTTFESEDEGAYEYENENRNGHGDRDENGNWNDPITVPLPDTEPPSLVLTNGTSAATGPATTVSNLTHDTEADVHKFKEIDYSLRPKVIKMAKAGLKDALRCYMLRPVIRSVEMDEPLEYLTEMRQVVIVFINVVVSAVGAKRLIGLVDAAYKLICTIVGRMQGCVNKTSLFDKDLMFLCIFGLRGNKHELEAQIGLRCASKVRESLTSMRNVQSVSVGVTTGLTYCGVVGHVLRREYTVIGMAVNKAARLMCAYRGKVVCDQESFLRSRLETRYFTLQEPRYLKGIANVGPVYEFQERAKYSCLVVLYQAPDLVWSKYPLLGRDTEINIFRQTLATLVKYKNAETTKRESKPAYNTLIIKGEPRVGKTRLLDEITQNIPAGVACNYVSLTTTDSQTPYSLIQLIFSVPLGLTVTSSRKEREDKLILRLGRVRKPHFLCALNQPFNVRFAIGHRYKSLQEIEKKKVLRRLLAKLAKLAFWGAFWVVLVDDAEYGDQESLELFDAIREHDSAFFVVSVGRKLTAEYKIDDALLTGSRMIDLAGIDKWYHAGLACQVLNIDGIPAELERLIQERSLGNPGWIESYLVSLLQGGQLVIWNISKREAELMGYVLPPITMLKRLVSSDTVLANLAETAAAERTDSWRMYRASYRDSAISILHKATKFMSRGASMVDVAGDDENTVAVCKISGNFSFADINAEITTDVMILKLFDSLSLLDQLLLKRASVLGEIVNRHMLESLMDSTPKREIGLGISKLFEIRVLGCGIGDFSTNPSEIIFSRNVRTTGYEPGVLCWCKGLDIPKELADLPRYASCGLMRFKTTEFRDTMYRRLLTENQKMELHGKALKYLKQNTRRCAGCGGRQFTKLLGKTFTTPQEDKLRENAPIYHVLSNTQIGAKFRKESASAKPGRTARIPCLNIGREMERKLTSTFSNVDFANCQCHLILITVYTQALEHCRGIRKNSLTLTATLEFVQVCLMSYNIPQARNLLKDAEALVRQMFKSSEEKLIVLPYLMGKIETLRAKCWLELGLIEESERTLETAIDSLGYKFPKLECAIRLKAMIQSKEARLKLSFARDRRIDRIYEENDVDYAEQLAETLSLFLDVFKSKGMGKEAHLAAIWSLNAALTSNKNFIVLCKSFTNVLMMGHTFRNKYLPNRALAAPLKHIPSHGKQNDVVAIKDKSPDILLRSMVRRLINEGINISHEKQNSLEIQELRAITELYASIFFARWINAEVAGALRIGFICNRMSQTIASTFLKLNILPGLIHLSMITCQRSRMVALLRELEFLSGNETNKSARTWYYALCIDVQLDTGLSVLTIKNCEQYYLRHGKTMISLREKEAQKRYFTSMWLWCVRTGQWETSKLWNDTDLTSSVALDEHAVTATITALKRIEGLLISYVHRVNCRNVHAVVTMAEIERAFKNIRRIIGVVKIAIPRYTLLKAYYCMIRSQSGKAMKLLRKVKQLSLKMENRMMYGWAEHCQKAWSGTISSVQQDLWANVYDDKLAGECWDEVNTNDNKPVPFTFPLATYTV